MSNNTPPKPHESWVLDETTNTWEPPVPFPTDGKTYYWDEKVKNWIVAP